MACESCESHNSHAYSPCAKLSDSMALIRIDNSNPCTTLAEAFPHAGMKSFIHAGVSTQFLPNSFPRGIAEAYDDPVTQITLFRGTQTLMDYLFDKFRFASRLVVSASNAELERGEIPEGIPKDILNTELSMPIDIVGFDTPVGVFHFCQNLEKLFSKVTQWIHGRVRLSIAKGLGSQVNWGSFLDITHRDFLDMVAPGMADITWPAPERDVAMRNPEDDDSAMDEVDDTLALIFHSLECNAIHAGLLLPYDPTSPDFDINYYTPLAYITNRDKDVYGLLDYLVMDIKGAFVI
ncbi:hypothetical protein AAF712_015410 [Marasmius tenuissimus]|uniref:Uncharacterized protein n=1 Tax=Marasmius tenuissimus TaxID=585030 RepID=A0ABR2Z8B4_9AGAR